MARFLVLLMLVSISLAARADDKKYFYIIKKNDLVSELLYRANLRPIYGKNRSLDKMQAYNKKYDVDDVDRIKPGEKLYFPASLALDAKAQGAIEISPELQITYLESFVHPDEIARNTATEPKTSLPKDPNVATGSEQEFVETQINLSPQSTFSVAFETGFTRLDATQNAGSAALLSKPLLGLNVQWNQHWSDKWQSSIAWSTKSVALASTKQGTVLGGNTQSLSDLSIGLKYFFNAKTSADVFFGTREDIFSPSYSLGTATLETRPITFAKVSVSRNLVEVRNLSLMGYLGGTHLFGQSLTDYDIHTGLEYFGGLRVTHRLKTISVFASGEYSETTHDTSLFELSRKNIRTQFGLIFPLGAED